MSDASRGSAGTDQRSAAVPAHDRWLHWSLALLIVSMLVLGKVVDEMEQRGAFALLRSLHINLGLLVLLLGGHRILRRLRTPLPPAAGVSARERAYASLVQWTLMLATVLMPLSGLAMAVARRVPIELFGLVALPRLPQRIGDLGRVASEVHELTAWLIVLCLGLHVAGAMKHHLLDRDDTLRRMLRG